MPADADIGADILYLSYEYRCRPAHHSFRTAGQIRTYGEVSLKMHHCLLIICEGMLQKSQGYVPLSRDIRSAFPQYLRKEERATVVIIRAAIVAPLLGIDRH